MNATTSYKPILRAARRWRALALAGTVTLACAFGAPALAQSPGALANPVVTASSASSIEAPAVINSPMGAGSATNPYGLSVVWAQGDWVARTTLILLAFMSLLSWYVIVAKLLDQRRQSAQALSARAAFANADSLQKGATALAKNSPFRVLVDSAMDALRKYESLAGQVEVGIWLSQDIVRNIATLQMRMQSGLSVLATVGSTAPFVGLFGTVWGIYNALVTIGSTGQASIDKVAGPVGEALIMTALGLAVAVPAVLGYNWLVRRNRVAMHSAKGFGSDLHTLLLIEIEKSQRAGKTAKAHD